MKMLISARVAVTSFLAMIASTAMPAQRRRLRFAFPLVLGAAIALSGCAATQVYLENKDLQVQTRMSATVFLPPATPGKRTVWVDVRNTSDQDIDLGQLGSLLTSRGYRIVDNPEKANYHLQANILYVGRDDKSAIRQSSLYGGWGGPVAGVAAGTAAGAGIGGTPLGVGVGGIVGGIVGGVAEMIAGSLVKSVVYTMVTDIQIAERSAAPVAQTQHSNLQQGTATTVTQNVTETSGWKLYRTRIVSTATKVNLDFNEAKPQLTNGLLKSVANSL